MSRLIAPSVVGANVVFGESPAVVVGQGLLSCQGRVRGTSLYAPGAG
jgi:hypothetical protein